MRNPRSVWSDGYRDVWSHDMKAAGHTPILDDGGGINMFVTDAGFHNGPGCSTCGWTCCQHCWGDKPIPPCALQSTQARKG